MFLVAALLALHWWLAATGGIDKSPAFDEVAHLAAGYLYWTAGDFRFNAESGNLTQRWAALPLLFQDLAVPPPGYPPRRQANVWAVGRDLLFRLGNDAETMLFAARSMIALLSAALGALVYLWSRSLYGRPGAVVSLLLFVFSPTVLAHAGLVTADLAAAFFFLLSAGAMGRLLERATAGRLAAAGIAVAGLVLAKMSWPLVLPIAALLTGWRLARRPVWPVALRGRVVAAASLGGRAAVAAGAGLAVTAVVVASVWAAYDFRAEEGGPFLHSWESRLEDSGVAAPAIRFARDHRLLPEAFLWGFAYTLATTQERDSFLNGEVSATGWSTFFPYAFLVKTPLPFLALLLMAMASARRGRGEWRTLPLWVLLGVYGASAIASPLNLGHRHLLPLYPVLFIFAGRTGRWLAGPWKTKSPAGQAAAAAVAVLVVFFAADSWRIRPHYLSYFNAIAGGPANGYRHLVDSSLDWGQDLPALADWLAAEHPSRPVYAAYFGSALPAYYGIEARWLHSYFEIDAPPPRSLEGGVYCVSATLLQTLHTGRPGPWTPAYEEEYQDLRRRVERFRERPREEWPRLARELDRLRSVRLFHFLQRRTPDARAAWSILVFRLSDDEARRFSEGPPPLFLAEPLDD